MPFISLVRLINSKQFLVHVHVHVCLNRYLFIQKPDTCTGVCVCVCMSCVLFHVLFTKNVCSYPTTDSPHAMDGEYPSTVVETKKIFDETTKMIDTNRNHCRN